jgi:hypothetical protein
MSRTRVRSLEGATGPLRSVAAALTLAGLMVGQGACDGPAVGTGRGESGEAEGWPAGTVDERVDAVARHVGGFSVTMREVGYRHNELYFAGLEENWALADYHLEHIEEAVEDGVERRPARAASARFFMEQDLPAMAEALEAGDSERFLEGYRQLTRACNVCHQREDMGFLEVRIPDRRLYAWRTPGSD